MSISKKIKSEVVIRLERIANGQPPVPRKVTNPREPWRRMESRGAPTICAACEGCGRMNYYHVRRMHRRWEWHPFHPRAKAISQNATSSMKDALKHRVSKGLLEQICDLYSKEIDEQKQPE